MLGDLRARSKGPGRCVHGDDFVFGGSDEDLKWLAKVLAAKIVIKAAEVNHRKLLLERFVMEGHAKVMSEKGDWGAQVSTVGGEKTRKYHLRKPKNSV